MTALIAFSMFPAVTLAIAALSRAERRLTDADQARRAEPPVTHVVT